MGACQAGTGAGTRREGRGFPEGTRPPPPGQPHQDPRQGRKGSPARREVRVAAGLCPWSAGGVLSLCPHVTVLHASLCLDHLFS